MPIFIDRIRRLFYFIAIVVVNLIIYWPSLFHLPRSDQWWYLLDTLGKDNFFTLVRDYYSFPRVRFFVPQDVLSFRPLWCSFLGLEKSLFGNNFILWQAAGIFLHLVVLWLLFCLIYKNKGYFAIFFEKAGNFTVYCSNLS